ERLRALVAAVSAVHWLHTQGIAHRTISPRVLTWRDESLQVLLGPTSAGPAASDEDIRRDLSDLARVAASLEIAHLPEAAPLGRLGHDDAPVTPRKVLAAAAEAGVPCPEPLTVHGRTHALQHLARTCVRASEGSRPIALVGPAGSQRAGPARQVLAERARQGATTLGLSQTRAPLLALHRLLFPPERPPTPDAGWMDAARAQLAANPQQGVLFVG